MAHNNLNLFRPSVWNRHGDLMDARGVAWQFTDEIGPGHDPIMVESTDGEVYSYASALERFGRQGADGKRYFVVRPRPDSV